MKRFWEACLLGTLATLYICKVKLCLGEYSLDVGIFITLDLILNVVTCLAPMRRATNKFVIVALIIVFIIRFG